MYSHVLCRPILELLARDCHIHRFVAWLADLYVGTIRHPSLVLTWLSCGDDVPGRVSQSNTQIRTLVIGNSRKTLQNMPDFDVRMEYGVRDLLFEGFPLLEGPAEVCGEDGETEGLQRGVTNSVEGSVEVTIKNDNFRCLAVRWLVPGEVDGDLPRIFFHIYKTRRAENLWSMKIVFRRASCFRVCLRDQAVPPVEWEIRVAGIPWVLLRPMILIPRLL